MRRWWGREARWNLPPVVTSASKTGWRKREQLPAPATSYFPSPRRWPGATVTEILFFLLQRSTPKTINLKKNKRVLVSNLDTEISEEEIWEIFTQIDFGKDKIKDLTANYNADGSFAGTAIINFYRARDAEMCVKEYDGALVDQREFYLDFIVPFSALQQLQQSTKESANGSYDRKQNYDQGYQQGYGNNYNQGYKYRGQGRRGGRRGGRGGRRGGRKGKSTPKKQQQPKDPKDLDKELEEYHAKAKQKTTGGEAAETK